MSGGMMCCVKRKGFLEGFVWLVGWLVWFDTVNIRVQIGQNANDYLGRKHKS